MPETSLSGRSTRTARNVRRSGELFFLILIVAKLKTEEEKQNRIFNSENNLFFLLHYPVTTTTKSITFQRLRRYESLCNTKPSAIIFSAASKQKIPIK